jgi:hypothetical protein
MDYPTLLIATAAVAQQIRNQYEPPNMPGAGQRLLAQFVGDWDVVKTFFPINGKPIVTKGTRKQYMIQDGKFLQSDFTFLILTERRAPAPESPASIPKRIASPPRGTTRGRRRCRFARATARSTARTSSCGPRPSIPSILGARPSRVRTLRKTAAFSSIAIS